MPRMTTSRTCYFWRNMRNSECSLEACANAEPCHCDNVNVIFHSAAPAVKEPGVLGALCRSVKTSGGETDRVKASEETIQDRSRWNYPS